MNVKKQKSKKEIEYEEAFWGATGKPHMPKPQYTYVVLNNQDELCTVYEGGGFYGCITQEAKSAKDATESLYGRFGGYFLPSFRVIRIDVAICRAIDKFGQHQYRLGQVDAQIKPLEVERAREDRRNEVFEMNPF